jgi:hypothetical protein
LSLLAMNDVFAGAPKTATNAMLNLVPNVHPQPYGQIGIIHLHFVTLLILFILLLLLLPF